MLVVRHAPCSPKMAASSAEVHFSVRMALVLLSTCWDLTETSLLLGFLNVGE